VVLEKAASLTGRVLNAAGAPQRTQLVQLFPAASEGRSAPKVAVTDAEGRYRFGSLDAGEMRVQAGGMSIGPSSASSAPVSKTVVLEAGKETVQDLVLP
jgi:hypothetical protein